MDDFHYMMQKHANGFTSGNNGRLGILEYVFEKGIIHLFIVSLPKVPEF